MKLFRLLVLLLLVSGTASAASVPLLTGPQDPSQMNATINSVINSINAILIPLTGGNPGPAGVNGISLGSAPTGGIATISLQAGADPNAPIGISPNGNGNVILFPPAAGTLYSTSTGMLQFGSFGAFVKANAFAACPGMAPNRPPMLVPGGLSTVVTGFWMVSDWLGFQYAIPACGGLINAAVQKSG